MTKKKVNIDELCQFVIDSGAGPFNAQAIRKAFRDFKDGMPNAHDAEPILDKLVPPQTVSRLMDAIKNGIPTAEMVTEPAT